MILPINDTRYFATVHREEPALPYLLMLHGFMGSSAVFEPLIAGLAKFCNPITLDLLGHGKTESPDLIERFSSQCQVKDLDDIITKLERRPLFLHGYSMGGRLALQYATLHPEHLAGLILESANPGLKDAEARAERLQVDERRASAVESDFEQFLIKWEGLPLFNTGIDIPEERLELYRTVQHGQNPEAMAASLRGFGTGKMPHAWDRLERIRLPVLLLAGKADSKYCTICSDMSKLIPNSSFYKIENAGHRVHLENLKAFVGRLETFVNTVP